MIKETERDWKKKSRHKIFKSKSGVNWDEEVQVAVSFTKLWKIKNIKVINYISMMINHFYLTFNFPVFSTNQLWLSFLFSDRHFVPLYSFFFY